MKRKFVKVTAACVGGAIVLGNAASVSASALRQIQQQLVFQLL